MTDEKSKKSADELNEELYVKLSGELVDYRNELLTMRPQDILDHAYRYAIREDIVDYLEFHDISAKQAEQLLKADHALDAIYEKYEAFGFDHNNRIKQSIECKANELGRAELIETFKAKKAQDRDAR